jgi:hypothetical protein
MGHLLVVVKQQLLGQEVRNTLWFGGGDATIANAQDIVDEVADAWVDELKPSLVDDWNLYGFDVYDKEVAGFPAVALTPTGGTIVGDSAADPLPTQIAGLVKFTAPVAPPNRNRKYLCGFHESSTTAGLFTATVTGHMQDWADRLLDIAAATSLGITLEVVALALDGTVVGGNPLEAASVSNNPATQRRRRLGVGI